MTISFVYICTKEGHRLFSKSYKGRSQINPTLFSCMISAISSFGQETMGEGVNEFKFETTSIFIKDFGNILVVLVAEFPSDIEKKTIGTIGMKFIEAYGARLRDWKGDVSLFSDFERTLDEDVFGKRFVELHEDKEKRITAQVLDSMAILNLSKPLQETALALLLLKEATIAQIAQKTKNSITTERRNLEYLTELGYVGKKRKKGTNFYFI